MPRAKSTGGSSPVKKSKTPSRHTTPRKKSKTPSRKNFKKSPGPKRGRSRSISKSRAVTPKKASGSVRRKSPQRKPSKSPSVKSSPQEKTPRGRGRPRSNSRSSSKSSIQLLKDTIPSIGHKISKASHVIEHKISSPIESVASKLRSRRAVYERSLENRPATSYSSRRAPIGQSIWSQIRNSRAVNYIRGVPRRLRWNNVKRSLKKNWRRLAILTFVGIGAYYSYQNKKAIEKALNEQYAKLSALVEQHKGSTFSKYFNGWYDSTATPTTQQPPTIPPRTVDHQQVPQPQHHATQTV